MQAELLSVGTELLLGEIVDTNAAYLAEKLSELGISVYHKTTVGDNTERLVAALRISLARADVVLATGGLGPTEDDVTAAAIAQVAGVDLVEDEATAERIRSFARKASFARQASLARQHGRGLLDKLLKQARVPRGAEVVPNPVGTAPGLILTCDSKTVIALPGVPTEMKAMAEQTVLPYLVRRAAPEGSAVIVSRVLRLAGMGESQAEAEIADLIRAQTNPTIAPLAKMQEVHLRIAARAADRAGAEELIAPVESEIRRRLGDHVYGADEETLEVVLGRLLRAGRLTLAAAESCTGGLIGHRLTNVPGSSEYFLGSLVTYSNEAKVALLRVPEEMIQRHGAVSAETARAMAEGAREACGADLGLSVTGIAGPTGGTAAKPVGLTYVGLAGAGETAGEEYRLRGNRAMVKERAAQAALYVLYRALKSRAPAEVAR
ncbi:MAG: competence/damage-inducible protein A [Armatimonadota bacterium]|nr:MAG: competence/damage-inducible protein A [Armatimonadota bacterium]